MEFVSSQNGFVTSYNKAYSLSPDVVFVEGSSQIYNEEYAEKITVAGTFNLTDNKLNLRHCPASSEDQIIYAPNGNYLAVVDKKNFTITINNDNLGIKKFIKLQDVAKIVCSSVIGSIDYYPERNIFLLTTVMKAKNKDVKNYDVDKFVFKDNLGEAMDDIEDDVKIFLICTETGKTMCVETDLNVVKAGIAADGSIFFTALDRSRPRNTGIIYCSNKPIGLYKYSAGNIKPICTAASCRSLTFSRDRQKFIYLNCLLGGPHFQPSEVVLYDAVTGTEKILVSELCAEDVFDMNLTGQQWTEWIYMTCSEGFYSRIIRVNTETGGVEYISKALEDWSIVSVLDKDIVIAQTSSILHPPTLAVYKDGKLQLSQDKERKFAGTSSIIQVHKHCEALVVRPQTSGPLKDTVVMMPHGGPNSNYIDAYLPYLACLLEAGYSVCRINYTGSYGYGRESLNLLVKEGKVGVTDVSDCMLVYDELVKLGFKIVHIFGGSHGGFLAALLSSLYPNAFKSCVLINPVIALYANCVASDIFDYFYENLGLDYSECRPPKREEMDLFYSRSPRPTKSNPPTLVLIGGKDRRVPPFNGLSWYGWLRGLGVKTRCLHFPDSNHGISQPEADRNMQVATLEFLKSYN